MLKSCAPNKFSSSPAEWYGVSQCTVWIITGQTVPHADGTCRQQTKQISSKPTYKQRKGKVLGAWYQQCPIRQQRIQSLHAVKCVTFNQFIRLATFRANNSDRPFGMTNCVTSEHKSPHHKKVKNFKYLGFEIYCKNEKNIQNQLAIFSQILGSSKQHF